MLISRRDIVEVGGRMDAAGAEIEPLSGNEVHECADAVAATQPAAVAVALLFSPLNDAHEHRISEAVRLRLPGTFVMGSADAAPDLREYERWSTALISAYLGPLVAGYLGQLRQDLEAGGLRVPVEIMRSSGGVASLERVVGRPVDLLLSGPAGGVAAALSHTHRMGKANTVAFDMGGTSCDISIIHDGKLSRTHHLSGESRFDGWEVLGAALDIQSIGYGGGSIAWVDAAGGLHVGPRSAGAEPGPAAYGTGGLEPTVTDAAVHLGYIAPGAFLAGRMELDPSASDDALTAVATPLGLSPTHLAAGIYRITSGAMADGIRVALAARGLDARDFDLLCFGGAAGLHAADILEQLGMSCAFIPREAAGFSALGMLSAPREVDGGASLNRTVDTLDRAVLQSTIARVEGQIRARLDKKERVVALSATSEMRYLGQTHEVMVPIAPDRLSSRHLRAAFEESYQARFGYRSAEAPVELVNLRLRATLETPELAFASDTTSRATEEVSARTIYAVTTDQWVEARVLAGGSMDCGSPLAGPLIVECPLTTIVVPTGATAVRTTLGDFELRLPQDAHE
jgi:N-methylhydantoinase A